MKYFICETANAGLIPSNVPKLHRVVQTSKRQLKSLYQCSKTGDHISQILLGNGQNDCSNDSEEDYFRVLIKRQKWPENFGQFVCENGSAISLTRFCNFEFDCIDHGDEMCVYPECHSKEFQCENKQCFGNDRKCDGVKHCKVCINDVHKCFNFSIYIYSN